MIGSVSNRVPRHNIAGIKRYGQAPDGSHAVEDLCESYKATDERNGRTLDPPRFVWKVLRMHVIRVQDGKGPFPAVAERTRGGQQCDQAQVEGVSASAHRDSGLFEK
jgi:hypothetical protein